MSEHSPARPATAGPAAAPVTARSRRILIVDDDPNLVALIAWHLRDAGWDVQVAVDGQVAIEIVASGGLDAIVLDVMLPRADGLIVCQAIRRQSRCTPVLMVSGRSGAADRIRGLEAGADDYLIKPFSFDELVARVRALFRRVDAAAERQHQLPSADTLHFPTLSIDPTRRRLMRDQREVALTAKEFDLLLFLASRPGRVFTRAQLLEHVWGYGHGGYGHAVSTHINRLRNKIEQDPVRPRLVLTVWGVGYRFSDALD